MNTFRIRTLFVTLALLAFSLGGLLMGCGGSASAPAAPKDTIAPTLAISGTSATVTKDPVTLTFIFSEDVGSSFTASDVTVTNGTAAAAVTKVDATHYTLVVTPAAGSAGTMTISVAAGAFSDVASNASAAAATATQAYDTQAPTVAITGTSATVARGAVTLTFTFSEDVGTSFAASDVTVTNGTAAASVTKVDATHYTLVVTPTSGTVGTLGASVAIGAFADVVGNASTAAATASQVFDTMAPAVAITGTSSTVTKTPPPPCPPAGTWLGCTLTSRGWTERIGRISSAGSHERVCDWAAEPLAAVGSVLLDPSGRAREALGGVAARLAGVVEGEIV